MSYEGDNAYCSQQSHVFYDFTYMKTVSLTEIAWDSNRMKQLGKALKTRQLFSLEMALNIYEWRFTVPKTVSDCKK